MPPKKKSTSAAVAAVAKQNDRVKKVIEAEEKAISDKKTTKNSKTTDTTTKEEPVVEENTKVKRAPTKYQLFFKQKLTELREEYDDPETRPSYNDMRTMINEEWHKDNPKPEKTSSGVKKVRKPKKSSSDDTNEKPKRAPTAYNIFIKEIMPQIKSEHENDTVKLNQKDIMKLAAEKWNQHKQSIATK
jgi:hypothetical protein